jgi:quinol monooxygenase YgiN
MLVRIVRMTFSSSTVEAFLDRFDSAAPKIRSFSGCEHLELWRDADAPAVCTTYSHWASAAALDAYRQSDLFRQTWAQVTPLFSDRPQAHSYSVARPARAIADAARSTSDS